MMDGDFSPANGPLNNYIPVTENADGTVTQGAANYEGARRTVNGTDKKAEIAAIAERIAASIATYRAGVQAQTITKDLASYLIEDTTLFDSGEAADAQRLLVATGHLDNFGAPGFGSDRTDQQERYQNDVRQTGYAPFLRALNTSREIAALTAFQQEFNREHNLDTPLPEDGRLDERTLHALTRAGQIQSGTNMINYAFHGEVQAINPVTQAWERQQAGQMTLAQLAATLVSLMPVPNANDVIGMLDSPTGIGTELAFQLSAHAPTHNDLAYFNRAILTKMQSLLTASSNPRHQAMATRLADVLGYTPPRPAHNTYTVVRGDSMGAIAQRLGMTVQALLDYNNANGNPIRNANSISVGQAILYPNPDGATQGEASPTAELSRYEIPAEDTSTAPAIEPQAPTSEGAAPDTSLDAEKQGEEGKDADTSKGETLYQKFVSWLSGLWAGGE
jgi:LysM repeat protein